MKLSNLLLKYITSALGWCALRHWNLFTAFRCLSDFTLLIGNECCWELTYSQSWRFVLFFLIFKLYIVSIYLFVKWTGNISLLGTRSPYAIRFLSLSLSDNLVEIRIPMKFSVLIQTEICPYDPQIFNFHFFDTPQTCKIILSNHHQSFVRKYYFFAFVQISSFSYVQFKGCTLYYCSSSTLPVYNHRRLTDVTIYKYK